MLSYQHSYHAGCFADVMKHVVLTRLLHYLTQKDKPLLYCDTHAGRGLYDLQDAHALKTREAQQGIHLLWEHRQQLSSLFSPYLDILTQLNAPHQLRYYPGSPQIALELLRPQDRLVFCELHPGEFNHLSHLNVQKSRAFLKKEDGLNALKALLPPLERRGLVFLDPSYERKTEYQEVVSHLQKAYKRCATMTYGLWYPILGHHIPQDFLNALTDIEPQKFLRLEFYKTQQPELNMTGSGLWIINPPYVLAEEARLILKELSQIIQPQDASYLLFP